MILHQVAEGAGQRVLLVHPVGIDLTFLEPLAARLTPRYRVMRMDLRGHGSSPLLPLADGLEDFADDVHETLAQQNFAPCTVVGFSFGGMVAQVLALRHPEDVSALIPCACPCTLKPERRAVSLARGVDSERDGIQAVIEATMARWFTAAFRQTGGDLPAREHLLAKDPRGWAQGWRAIAKIDTLPKLSEIRVPTLCIAGELDVSSPPENLAQIANAIPGATLKVIAGAPHMLFIEQPQAVAQAILAFLDRQSAPGHQPSA